MLLIFPLVNFRHSEEVCEIGAFVLAGVIFYFLFKSFSWWIRHFLKMFLSFCSFHLVYQLKAHVKLNGPKWLNEMEQRNSEKKQNFLVLNDKWFFCLLTFNSRADITTRYNFNQARCFFIFNRFHGLIGYTSKIHEWEISGPHQYICLYSILHRIYFLGKSGIAGQIFASHLVVLN